MTDRNCTIQNPPKQAKRKKQKYTTESFINRASKKHSGYYKYDRVVCNNALDKVEIYCPSCDAYFIQQAAAHLYGQGCGLCARYRAANSKRRTTNDFIELANKVHGVGRYDYSGVKYTLSTKNVDIKCNLCQLVFSQQANGHLTGQGCAHCAGCKRLTTEQFVVKAVIKCYEGSEVFYKIGVTSRTIKQRYNANFPYRYSVVYEVVEDGGYIYDLENKIHALLKDHHYSPKIDFKGSVYECFTKITKPVEKLLKQLESTEQLQLLA